MKRVTGELENVSEILLDSIGFWFYICIFLRLSSQTLQCDRENLYTDNDVCRYSKVDMSKNSGLHMNVINKTELFLFLSYSRPWIPSPKDFYLSPIFLSSSSIYLLHNSDIVFFHTLIFNAAQVNVGYILERKVCLCTVNLHVHYVSLCLCNSLLLSTNGAYKSNKMHSN